MRRRSCSGGEIGDLVGPAGPVLPERSSRRSEVARRGRTALPGPPLATADMLARAGRHQFRQAGVDHIRGDNGMSALQRVLDHRFPPCRRVRGTRYAR